MFNEISETFMYYILNNTNKWSDKKVLTSVYTQWSQMEQHVDSKMVKMFTSSCCAAELDIRIRVLYFLGNRNMKSGY